MTQPKSLSYADAGVSLTAWNDAKDHIGKLVSSTYTSNVVGHFGQFGGMFDISMLKNYDKPILVSSVDGVGTKLKIAVEMGIHDTVGEDLVNHCINDILVLGAQALFFLDYIGTGKLYPEVATKIVAGFARACKASGVVLIGGETAEMPGMYQEGDFDLSGTIVGVVDEKNVIDGRTIVPGDVIIGLRSNGLHTNGYSLARKIVTDAAKKSYRDIFEPTGKTLGEELLRTHRSYAPVISVMRAGLIKGCAHITGGGFPDNIDRVLPPHCDAAIDTKSFVPDPIFTWLGEQGNVEPAEMYHAFNMGIGLILVVDPKHLQSVKNNPDVAQFDPVEIGTIVSGSGKVCLGF